MGASDGIAWSGIAGWAHAGGDLVDSSGRPTRRISPWCQAGFCRGDDSDWQWRGGIVVACCLIVSKIEMNGSCMGL